MVPALEEAVTGSNGTYTLQGLSAGTYDVCFATSTYFNPNGVTGGSSTTGYGNQCYNDVTWDGSASDISGATAVHVTAGATTSSINAALPNGGVIAGTVDDSSSHPLSDALVEVVSTSGNSGRLCVYEFGRVVLDFGPLCWYLRRVLLQHVRVRVFDHRVRQPVLQRRELGRIGIRHQRSDSCACHGGRDDEQHQCGASQRRSHRGHGRRFELASSQRR